MLGDSIVTALSKMKQMDPHQHSDGLPQEFYAMIQGSNESIGKYTVRLDMASGKVQLQSPEALGSTADEQERLLVNCLLQSMHLKLQARVAHLVDGKATAERPAYYKLVKFAAQKEAEINFNGAKKTKDSASTLKAMSHFHFNHKKSGLPATPTVRMVAPAPEEDSGIEEATPLPNEESDSGESHKAVQENTPISQGEVEVAVRVANAMEAFTGQCFKCNKVRH